MLNSSLGPRLAVVNCYNELQYPAEGGAACQQHWAAALGAALRRVRSISKRLFAAKLQGSKRILGPYHLHFNASRYHPSDSYAQRDYVAPHQHTASAL